jgi:acyl dehydratase
MPTKLSDVESVKAAVGQELGTSGWYEVSQDVIQAFADATGDHNFIHVDPERAKATPFGGTIAHGLLTLSLGPKFMYELLEFGEGVVGVNYGYAKVRFPAPVPSGSKLRMAATLSAADEVPGGLQLTVTQTFEVEGGTKPVCVADALVRIFLTS